MLGDFAKAPGKLLTTRALVNKLSPFLHAITILARVIVEVDQLMDERYTIQHLLALRKLTRATADLLREQMRDYISTLAPLIRPRNVLGEYVQSSTKDTVKGADAAFKELQTLYQSIAPPKPFSLTKELKPPLEPFGTTLEMTVVEYKHTATTDQQSKNVTITSPFKWVISYPGYSLARLRELATDRNRSSDELQRCLLHFLALHIVLARQPGLGKILEALQFPLSTERLPDFGELPITYISSTVSTLRPPDEMIIENTEISGMDAFEEIINIDDIVNLRNPLRERLIELVKSHGENLLPE